MARVLSDEKLAELMAKCFAHCKFLETIVLHVVRVLHVLPLSLQVAKRPTDASPPLIMALNFDSAQILVV
jgi:hypothetical protein